jgi:hypothetical protein
MSATRRRLLPASLILICLCGLARADTPKPPADDGFVLLFDGKTLDGWKGDLRFWRVEDGAITGETTKDNPSKTGTFLVWAGGTVQDFELTCMARITGGNSGVEYRARDEKGDLQLAGYQFDFGPGESHNGKLYEDGTKAKPGRAGLAYPGQNVVIRGPKDKQVVGTFGDKEKLKRGIEEGKWIRITIIARGNHLVHKLDGETVVEATDDDAKNRTLDAGLLGFQIHGGSSSAEGMKVQFKDIRLKKLPAPEAVKKS